MTFLHSKKKPAAIIVWVKLNLRISDRIMEIFDSDINNKDVSARRKAKRWKGTRPSSTTAAPQKEARTGTRAPNPSTGVPRNPVRDPICRI
jgi:hypothetical protein